MEGCVTPFDFFFQLAGGNSLYNMFFVRLLLVNIGIIESPQSWLNVLVFFRLKQLKIICTLEDCDPSDHY